MDLDKLELWKCLLTSLAIGLITALGSQFIYLPYVKKQIKNKYEVDKDEDNLKIDDLLKLGIRTQSYNEAVSIENTTTESNIDEIQPAPIDSPSPEPPNRNFIYNEQESIESNINESRQYTINLIKVEFLLIKK